MCPEPAANGLSAGASAAESIPPSRVEKRLSAGWWILWAVVILLPAALLGRLDARFYYDWQNHEWFIGYFGEYLRQHGGFPAVFNADAVVGLPQPIFYGWLFYPALGTLSAVTGAALALRIGIVAVFALQFQAIYLAARASGASRWTGTCIAAVVTWAVYPLTNLYNRAALTEFFAVALLTAGVAYAYAAVFKSGPRARLLIWSAGAGAIFAAGMHPPTAVLGGLFLLALVLTGVIALLVRAEPRWDLLVPGMIVTGVGLLMLAPWLYANVRLHDDLYIVVKLREFAFFPERTDSFVGRFLPIPYDAAAVKAGGQVTTPFAEAQLAMALVLLLGWNLLGLFRSSRGPAASRIPRSGRRSTLAFLAVSVAWLGFTVAMSLSPAFAGLFRPLAPYVQFPSRFVSHANLALLLLVLLTGRQVRARAGLRGRKGDAIISSAVLALALVGVALKLQHGAFVREIAPEPRYAWRGDRSGLVTQGRMDAATDYAAVRRLPQLLPDAVRQATPAAFPVGVQGTEFGRVGDVDVYLQRAGWVVTNAVPFAWSKVLVDGRVVAPADRAAVEHRAAFRLPAGRHHLQWVWQPDSRWRQLRVAAAVGTLALAGGLILLGLAALRDEAEPNPALTPLDRAAETVSLRR